MLAIRIRAFRAVDEQHTCEKYMAGHSEVLTKYGVTQVTTANTDWFHNPQVYGIIVEALDDNRALGGARVHVVGNVQSLPIEEAIGDLDTSIYQLVQHQVKFGTGELCGLWNSHEIAGRGVSVLLTKVGVALASQLALTSLFVFCAPYTVKMTQDAGFIIETSLGKNGTFYYPKEDLLATALILPDITELKHANALNKEHIFNLRIHPQQIKLETGTKGEIEVHYDLVIKNQL